MSSSTSSKRPAESVPAATKRRRIAKPASPIKKQADADAPALLAQVAAMIQAIGPAPTEHAARDLVLDIHARLGVYVHQLAASVSSSAKPASLTQKQVVGDGSYESSTQSASLTQKQVVRGGLSSESASASLVQKQTGLEKVMSDLSLEESLPPPRIHAPSANTYLSPKDWFALQLNWSREAEVVRNRRVAGVAPASSVNELRPGRPASLYWKAEELAVGWGDMVKRGDRLWVRYVVCRKRDGFVLMVEDAPKSIRCNNVTVIKGLELALVNTRLGGVTVSRFGCDMATKKRKKGISKAGLDLSEADELEALIWVLGRAGGQDDEDEQVA
ncbi:hypothetical protein HDU87_000675 [Geranomyces variabilis]|uniref:Uncharacterized protein n=1 Tax=Geranomyces variabilis TaxID=109894 RepID=A0AAD5XPJ7_9FUNG|nr:hypothetical protein HDU87_000675 [Geranomyces variabilis]